MAQRPSTPRIGLDQRPPSTGLVQSDRVMHQDMLDPATMAQLNAMDDFKRRHSKQNRDIVRDNANRLLVNRTLQEEIGKLHVTILQEREEKAALATELRRTREEMARIRSEGAREALDAIISSIPALKELRYQLGKASPPNSQQRMQNRKVDVEAWQAKPSVVNAGRPELEAVTETTERGSDSETGSVVAGAGRALSRDCKRETSPTRERSSARTRARLSSSASAASSVSSTATLAPPSHTEPPRRPRRESGMFGRARSPDPEIVVATPSEESPAGHVITTEPSPVEPVERRRISLTRRRRSMLLKADAAESEEADVEGYASGVRATGEKPVEVMALVEEDEVPESYEPASTSESSKLSSAPMSTRTETSSIIDGDGDQEGRVPRRARKSVNYKEPSLHTKMRKPGPEEKPATPYVSGINLLPDNPMSTATTSRSRSTLPGASSSTRSASAPISAASTPALDAFAVNGVLENEDDPFGEDLELDSSLEAAVSAVDARDAIVRRKSVLPKSRRVDSELGGVQTSVASSMSRKTAMPSIASTSLSTNRPAIEEPVRRRSVSASATISSTKPTTGAGGGAGNSTVSRAGTASAATPGPLARRPFSSVDNVTSLSSTSSGISHAPAAAVSSALLGGGITSSLNGSTTGIARGKSAMLSRRDSEAPPPSTAARLQAQASSASSKTMTTAALSAGAVGIENKEDGGGGREEGKDALLDAAVARRAARRRSSLMRAGGG